MTVRGADASELYAQQVTDANRVLQRYNELRDALRAQKKQTQEQLEAARGELAAVYLPELSEAAFTSAAQWTGYRGFARRNPIAAMQKEAARLEALIRSIVENDEYRRRTYLVGPVGEFTRALEEARSMLDPWARECAKFESLKDFQTLVELGYDTPGYTVRWWEPTYWRYWASGDAICSALGMGDFGDDVLPAYQKVRAPRDQWLGQVAAAEANVARVHELVRTHDHSVDRLARLPQIYLDEARKLLVKHLTMADASLLSTWAGDDRGIVMALRTVGGLQAKIDFLDDAAERGLTAFIMEMEHRRDKYRRKVQKYRRPKHIRRLIPDSELDRKFSTKLPKYYARADKLEKMADRVSNYDQYDRFELDNPPELWFYEFTGGKRPSRLTPSLRGWYERNPNRIPEHDTRNTIPRVAQAAPAQERLDELGYLS